MSDGIMSILVIAGLGIVCAAISYVGNRIADKAGDAIENAGKRKKNSEAETKKENLADRYR